MPAHTRSEAARLRKILDCMEATLTAGASHVAALTALHAQGVGHALPPTVSLRAPDGLTRFTPAETGLGPQYISPFSVEFFNLARLQCALPNIDIRGDAAQ